MNEEHSVREIAGMLADRAEVLCGQLLPAGRRHGNEWRVGSVAGEPGKSLGVCLRGPKAGVWADFATGESGDLITLIAAVERTSTGHAISWAKGWLGLDSSRPSAVSRQRAVRPVARPASAGSHPPRNVVRARRIWSEARPARGTLAEVYLHSRGLDMKIPPAIRFHGHLWHDFERRSFPALVAAVYVSPVQGEMPLLAGIWRLYLAPNGKAKAPVGSPKLGLGQVRGGAVWLTHPAGSLAVAEGIETALAIVQAVPALAVCSALSTGNMTVFEPPPWAFEIIFCADADPAGLTAAAEAGKRMKALGLKSVVAVPPKIMADFNDMLVS